MKTLLLVILLMPLTATLVLGTTSIDIENRIKSKELYLKVYDDLFGKKEYALKDHFKNVLIEFSKKSPKEHQIALRFIQELSFLPSQILMPLTYWTFIQPDLKKRGNVLAYYSFYRLSILRDHWDNPSTSIELRNNIKSYSMNTLGLNIPSDIHGDSDGVFYHAFYLKYEIESTKIANSSPSGIIEGLKNEPLFQDDWTFIFKDNPDFKPYSIDSLGWVYGNDVKIVNHNNRTTDRIAWYNERLIYNGGQKDSRINPFGELDFEASYMQMPNAKSYQSINAKERDYVTRPEQYEQDEQGHIAFRTDDVYITIREMIDQAQDKIFIDIFLFGGTLGGTLTKYLFDQAAKKRLMNPNFRVLLMHDYSTHYNMWPEMLPVFCYIKSRLNKTIAPDSKVKFEDFIYLLQANIHRHPPGIPFGITEIIDKKDDGLRRQLWKRIQPRFKCFDTQGRLAPKISYEGQSTYFESKIDHSKVIVIDPESDYPQAYFGSKNWTDHSGGYYFDDAIWIKGPAAALVMDSFHADIEAALTTDPLEKELFFFKESDPDYGKELAFDNARYLKSSTRNTILNEFKVNRKTYPALDQNIPIRLAEATVEGKIKNHRNLLIDLISKAEHNIYMEQLFIYDPYINDALIKRKIQRPSLDIKILADHNGNFGMNGLPNTLFLKEMKDHDILIRARSTVGVPVTFNTIDKKTGKNLHREYHQENHRKATTIDGKFFLGGSSNLNPDTLQGSFREFGAVFYHPKAVAEYECHFMRDWNNGIMPAATPTGVTCQQPSQAWSIENKTEDFPIDQFQLKLGKTLFDVETSHLINKLGSLLFRSKDVLEERHK